MFALLLALPAFADDADQQLVQVFETYLQHAVHPIPIPDPEQRAALLAGEIVKVRLPGTAEAPEGAMGMVLTDLPRQDLWLSSCDAHDGEQDRVLSHHLPLQGGEMFRWYGLIDVPSPFTDRHFLIQTTVNPALSAGTGGAMWGRQWRLEPGGEETVRQLVSVGEVDGVDAERFERAIYVPVNYGAWAFLEAPDGRTLFVYHASSSLGGEIPDGLVNRYVFWGLDEVIEDIVSRAAEMPAHYRGDHRQFMGGDGQLVPRYP